MRGHASTAVTEDAYPQVTPGMQADALAKVAASLSTGRSNPFEATASARLGGFAFPPVRWRVGGASRPRSPLLPRARLRLAEQLSR